MDANEAITPGNERVDASCPPPPQAEDQSLLTWAKRNRMKGKKLFLSKTSWLAEEVAQPCPVKLS